MISLRDILTSSKTFVVDTIEVLNMHGREPPENFGILSEDIADDEIPLETMQQNSFASFYSGDTMETLDLNTNECGNEGSEKDDNEKHATNLVDTELKEISASETKTHVPTVYLTIDSKDENTYSRKPSYTDFDFGYDASETLSIYNDCRRSSSLLDSLSVDHDDKEGGTDDMNEMDMPNPGSIQHFQRLFYPSVPCMNCASCYNKFTSQIFGDSFN